MTTLVISGASQGIGLETARWFLADGYQVINLSRTPAPDVNIKNYAMDFSRDDLTDQVAAFTQTLRLSSQIYLVHNAARLINDRANGSDTDAFREILNINVIAPHILNQALLPLMQPGSCIIYIGSTLSEKAVPNSYSYIVSKHALIGMMRATCQDLAGSQIHTCCICPGFTDTKMLHKHANFDAKVLENMASMSSFGRLIAPREIAATIKFSAENPVLNGAVIHANLGQIEN